MQKISLDPLHQTAAQYLAAAVLELFPDTLLLGGQGTSRYFYYDFILPFPLPKETLKVIEERMVQLYREQKEITIREMVPSNASAYFSSTRQRALATRMKEIEGGLVQMCQFGHFMDYCPHPFVKTWPFKPFFTLFEIDNLPGQGTRIIGALFPDKNELKAFVKEIPSLNAFNHVRLSQEASLLAPLEDNVWLWLPQGEIIRETLVSWWKKEITKQSFHLVSTPFSLIDAGHKGIEHAILSCHQACFEHSGHAKLAEIAYLSNEKNSTSVNALLEPTGFFSDRLTLFCHEEFFLQTCISSLQSILKMPRILGFEFHVVLGLSTARGSQHGGKRKEKYQACRKALESLALEYVEETSYRTDSEVWIEIKIADALGRYWSGPSISVPSFSTGKGTKASLTCSMFGAMERLVALLLEKTAGIIPLWLAPEQVRFIVMSEKAKAYAETLRRKLLDGGIRCGIDAGTTELRERLHRTLQEKIPYVICVGENELKTQTLPVRMLGAKQEERMSIEALCEVIKTVNVGVGL